MKTCTHCGETKVEDEFQRSWLKAKSTWRYQSPCKACRSVERRTTRAGYDRRNELRNEKYRTDPLYRAELSRRGSIYRYGVDLAELLRDQDGACAICYTEEPGPKGWAVDHDHKCCPGFKTCGECVRGVLCHNCNFGLGQFKDSKARLVNAAIYLMTRTRSEVPVDER